MNTTLFQFGEELPQYSVPVLNERAVRAAAGILFFFAMVTFMNAWLQGNFQPTRVFVMAFLLDFTLRIFISPKWSPSLIVGQWVVRKQEPEYVGAPQKRFAWAIGWVLALTMFYLVVLQGVVGPINLLVCGSCLLLLFFETAFGICIGCKVYDLLRPEKAQLCPGNVCTYTPPAQAGGTLTQAVVVVVFLGLVGMLGQWVYGRSGDEPAVAPVNPSQTNADAAEQERCRVPEFAKRIGHEQQWKLHNHCQ